MRYSKNSLNILTAKSYKGIGNAWVIKNLNGQENIEKIVYLLNKTIKGELTSIEEFKNLRDIFERKIQETLINYCDGFIAIGDPDFPQHNGNVKDSHKPVFLYYKGDINLLNSKYKKISVIGLLNPDKNIEERERKVVNQFVKSGAIIVSGLAIGCDSISHEESLKSKGKTLAILPSPLNKILPAKNENLAQKIVEEGGVLVTEYGTDYSSKMELNSRYKERDRLQAMFCETILLAASYAQNSAERWNIFGQKLDSGARLAMGFAKEYGIPRAVMYDYDIDQNNPMFDLNRDLINEQKDITIITQDNYVKTVSKIMNTESKFKNTMIQKNLFD
jgi:DNA processing protein